MPSRKQRRRREKSMRHDYEYVYVDGEGREVEVDEDELAPTQPRSRERSEAGAKPKPRNGVKPGTAKASSKDRPQRQPARGRGRVVEPPSWRRVGRRALIFAPLMFLVVTLLNRNVGLRGHVVQTLFLLAFFLPFSYVMDSIMYRTYRRRTGEGGTDQEPRKRGRV